MQMKKLVSFVAAAAMATAFCVPAFAATPGEEAADKAQNVLSLTESNWATNKEQAVAAITDLTSQVTNQQDITVTQVMNNAGVSFFDMAENNQDDSITKVEATSEYSGLQVVYRKDAAASDLTLNSFSYNGAGVITLDAVQEGTDSAYGYAMSIMLPASTDASYYSVSIVDGQMVTVTVPVTAYQDKDGTTHKMVTFWAPHFTTYQLTPVNVNNGGNEGGESNQGGEQTVTSDDNKEETTSTTTTTTTTTTVTENPIKATGVSMNMSVFAVVACAAVAACGAGVAVKKSHKGE